MIAFDLFAFVKEDIKRAGVETISNVRLYTEEEIEEITTEGARNNGIVPSASNNQNGSNPLALKTEMNKVDVIVDGRQVAGMYQVVHHRFETISTTTAVVPRSVADDHSQVSTDIIFQLCKT